MKHELLQTIFMLSGVLFLIGFCILFFFILRSVCRGFKKFLFDLMDHANDTNPRTGTSRNNYTEEAWRAYENVTQKKKKDEKPPWEE